VKSLVFGKENAATHALFGLDLRQTAFGTGEIRRITVRDRGARRRVLLHDPADSPDTLEIIPIALSHLSVQALFGDDRPAGKQTIQVPCTGRPQGLEIGPNLFDGIALSDLSCEHDFKQFVWHVFTRLRRSGTCAAGRPNPNISGA